MKQFTYRVWSGLGLAVLIGLLSVLPGVAQTGTPGAATPLVSVDCATLLGLGGPDDACIIVIHTAAGGPAVDVYADGDKVVDALVFGDVSGYLAVPGGAHAIDVVEAGADLATALISEPALELEAGTAYELAAIGSGDDSEALISPVDLSPMPPGSAGPTNTRVRAIHAVPDAPAVNVTVISDDATERAFEDISYPTVTDYIVRPAGSYRIQVEVAAMDFASIELDRVDFEGDTVYSMYAIGSVDSGDLRSLPVAVNVSTGESTARANPPAAIDEVVPVTIMAIYGGTCADSTGREAFAFEGSGHRGAGAGVVVPWGAGGEVSGAASAVPVQYAEGVLADINLGELLGGEDLSLVVRDGESGELLACGDIGGTVEQADRFWQHDRLVIGLLPVNDSGVSGTGTFVEDTGLLEDKINVSVALVESEEE